MMAASRRQVRRPMREALVAKRTGGELLPLGVGERGLRRLEHQHHEVTTKEKAPIRRSGLLLFLLRLSLSAREACPSQTA